MTMDPIPWLVGGGAEHSPEVARLLAYASTGGAEGIVGVSDLRVEALAVPGTAVQVAPGAALVRNRATSGEQQTYVGRNVSSTQVSVAPTGSSGGRSDLVVMQVEDPFVAGEPWQEPADPTAGPYIFVRVIPDVPNDATRLQDVVGYEGRSAVTLARVDLPASTGTVTGGMITDLREVALPRERTEVRAISISGPVHDEITETSPYPADGGQTWPSQAVSNDGIAISIPEWATEMKIIAMWGGVAMPPGNYAGTFWVQVAGSSDPNKVRTQDSGYNSNNKGEFSRETWVVSDTKYIPEALRGTVPYNFYPRASVTLSEGDAYAYADAITNFNLTVVFQEVPS